MSSTVISSIPFQHAKEVAFLWLLRPNATRNLLGKPMAIDSLNHVLRVGKQRQRIAVALELAMHQPGTPLFDTGA